MHSAAYINRQVPHIVAVRANGEIYEMAKMCCMLLTHTTAKWSVQGSNSLSSYNYMIYIYFILLLP